MAEGRAHPMTEQSKFTFTKIAKCEAGACVEIARAGGLVHIRSSRYPARVLTVSEEEWAAVEVAYRGEATQ